MTVDCPHCGGVSVPGPFCSCCGNSLPTQTVTDIPSLSPTITEMARADAPAVKALGPGDTIGAYRIDRFIGRGGMGAVYEGTHVHLSRKVAIKVLPPDLAQDPEFVRRFQREAQALARLQHPHIVGVHDMGIERSHYYFVMEFVDGVNLRHLLSHKLLTPSQALALVPKLCEALEYAHSQGIVHRDIKPENILIARDGAPKIADFGLAKIIRGDAAPSSTMTRTNVVMGTADYMAPEQRESSAKVDHRADIYSMGVVLYEMLTGDLPTGRFDMPSKRVQIDVRIDEVVLKALERRPEKRYQRASHMGSDVSGVGVPAAAAATPRRVRIRSAAEVSVEGWDRPDVEARGAQVRAGADAIEVEADDDVTVRIPSGVAVEISADDDISVRDTHASISIGHGGGDVSIRRHAGWLRLLGEDGDISIDGLSTEHLEIKTGTGDISVRGLELTSGEAAIESEYGDVDLRANEIVSSFSYEVRADGVRAELGRIVESGADFARGVVGTGAGRVSIRTPSGSVRLRGAAAPRGRWHLRITVGTPVVVMILLALAAWLFMLSGGESPSRPPSGAWTGARVSAGEARFESPLGFVESGDALFVAEPDELIRIDPVTGAEIASWPVNLSELPVTETGWILGWGAGEMVAYRFPEGNLLEHWRFEIPREGITRPAIYDAKAYFAGGSRVYAVDLTGRHALWDVADSTGVAAGWAPAVCDPTVSLFDASGRHLLIQRHDPRQWVGSGPTTVDSTTVRYFGGPVRCDTGEWVLPTAGDSSMLQVYTPNGDVTETVLLRSDGALLDLKPAVAGGVVLVAAVEEVVGVSVLRRQVAWRQPVGPLVAPPLAAGDGHFIAVTRDAIHLVRASDGSMRTLPYATASEFTLIHVFRGAIHLLSPRFGTLNRIELPPDVETP